VNLEKLVIGKKELERIPTGSLEKLTKLREITFPGRVPEKSQIKRNLQEVDRFYSSSLLFKNPFPNFLTSSFIFSRDADTMIQKIQQLENEKKQFEQRIKDLETKGSKFEQRIQELQRFQSFLFLIFVDT